MLSTTNIIDKKNILSQVSQERLMEYYLKITPSTDLVRSPFREDKKPGCSFWRNTSNDTLYFKDWAENTSLDFIGVVMKKYNISYYRALYKIILDMPSILEGYENASSTPLIRKSKLIQTILRATWEPQELEYWLDYGINLDILQKYNVNPVKSVYIDKELCMRATKLNPIFSYYFTKTDKVKIYRPLNKTPEGKWISSCGESDIFGEVFLKEKHNTLIITSSGKDAMVLNSLGFPAIAPVSESVLLSPKIIYHLQNRYKRIFVLMDNDAAGIKSNNAYKEAYNIIPLLVPLQYKAKDISDFRKLHSHKKTYKLVKKLLKEALIPRINSLPF